MRKELDAFALESLNMTSIRTIADMAEEYPERYIVEDGKITGVVVDEME